MTDLRKAAEMALEALLNYPMTEGKAIQALRQALAQPEQDDEAYGYAKYLAECIWEKHYKEESPHWRPFDNTLGVLTQIDNMTCGLEKAQPEQKPVAPILLIENRGTPEERVIQLYTAPPNREWVGLTAGEMSDIWCETTGRDWVNEDTHVYGEAIEAKLKEKNGA